MPQTTRRGVAPLKFQPRWPEGFLTVLRKAGAQQKNISQCEAGALFLCCPKKVNIGTTPLYPTKRSSI